MLIINIFYLLDEYFPTITIKDVIIFLASIYEDELISQIETVSSEI
jgi:hypothetical protein